MSVRKSNSAIALELLAAVFLWGANNTAVRFLVKTLPPGCIGSTRLLAAGLVLLGLLKLTPWLGPLTVLTNKLRRDLWLRCASSLAGYIICFTFALKYTSASHVALYLGMSPIWTLAWDHPPAFTWRSAQRYGAAALAFSGVVVLFLPALRHGGTGWQGEVLGLASSLLWANYGRQCHGLSTLLSGSEISAHSMWRAGVWLLPMAIFEFARTDLIFQTNVLLVWAYSVIGGGVMAYVLWNNALRHWRTSQVFLFNNLIPLTTMGWAWLCLGEPVTRTFSVAMILIVIGVVLGQARWEKMLGSRWSPAE